MTTPTTPWWREAYPEDYWRIFEDFKVFLRLVWLHLRLPAPTPIQLDIADYLQNSPKRAIIEAFRGVGKSWITAAFVCWLLLRDPQVNIMVVSASKDRADNFTTFVKRLIFEMEILAHLKPRSDQRNSNIAFDVGPALADQAPSVRSVGIMGQLTGGRADYIIPDDVEVPNNSETQAMRSKLAERVKEFDAVLKPGGSIKYLGTPQTEDSLYNKLPERGYEIRIWPARYPTAAEVNEYGSRLAPYLTLRMEAGLGRPGTSSDPKRFNDLDLMEREASYGRSGFALQFMLNTRLSDLDRYPLKLSDLVVTDLDADLGMEKVIWAGDKALAHDDLPCVGIGNDRYHKPMGYALDAGGKIVYRAYQGAVMIIDPSGRGKDETSWNVTKMLNSQVFLMEQGGYMDGYGEKTLTALAESAKKHKVSEIVVEANFGDGMFSALLRPYLQRIYPCTVTEVKHSVQKEKRIVDVLEPVMNQHRLIVDRKVIEQDYKSTEDKPAEEVAIYRLFYQMSRVTKDRGALAHDDRLDALAIAVSYWVEQMAADADEQVKEHYDEALRRELERFMEHAVGAQPAGDNWIN